MTKLDRGGYGRPYELLSVSNWTGRGVLTGGGVGDQSRPFPSASVCIPWTACSGNGLCVTDEMRDQLGFGHDCLDTANLTSVGRYPEDDSGVSKTGLYSPGEGNDYRYLSGVQCKRGNCVGRPWSIRTCCWRLAIC
ncbi:MAG: hypothetical protein VYA30_06190 [Myxococcota bacterium]|nr:hypothetical protein [Myxococcota bacterium]